MSKDAKYNSYVVRDDGASLHLYTFSSDNYSQPHAAAYAFTLDRSADSDDGFWIISSDKDLKSFLRQRKGARLTRGAAPSSRISNPRRSKVKDSLAIEATRHKKFSDFASEYWDACARGLYWYPTDEKRFHIGDAEKRLISKGAFTVYCSPSLALQGNAKTKYVAELDLTKVPKSYIKVKRGDDGAEITITDGADQIKILRVLESSQAKRAYKWQLSILPSSKEELRKFWESSWKIRNEKAERAAIRRRKEKEREAKRLLRLAQKAREDEERKLARLEREEQAAKSKRIERGRVAKGRKATISRAKEDLEAAVSARKASKKKSKAASTPSPKGEKKPKKGAEKKPKGKWKRVAVSNPGIRKVPPTRNTPRTK